MKKKRAQITIFIIIAVLILIIGVSIFLIKQPPKQKNIPANIQPINSYVQECIDETAIQAVFYISERGGYYNVPEKTIDKLTPYYLYEEENYMPSKEKIQEQLSLYVNEKLNDCINDFTDFIDFEIQQDEIKTTTEIKASQVLFNINYPLKISRQGEVNNLEDFTTTVPIRLGIVYEAIDKIMQEQIKDTSALDPNNIYEVSIQNDINVKMIGFIEDSVIFVTTDKNSKIDNQDFIFVFANKYVPTNPLEIQSQEE